MADVLPGTEQDRASADGGVLGEVVEAVLLAGEDPGVVPVRTFLTAAKDLSAAAAGAELELDGQPEVGGRLAGVGQALLEQGDRGGADGLHGLAHGGQRRLDVAAEVDAVEAGDRDLAWDVDAAR